MFYHKKVFESPIYFTKRLWSLCSFSSSKRDVKIKKVLGNSSLQRQLKVGISNSLAHRQIYSPTQQFQIPNFLDIQRLSFREFLQTGLVNEFNISGQIKNSSESIELTFYADKYKLNPPKWTPKQAILKRQTYACQLYLPVQLVNYRTNEIVLQWVLLGNLPLMTKNGHFIINGSPKIIMNQIVRSPGVYFQKSLKKDQKLIYSADFIAQRGAWLRLEVDSKKAEIWAKLKKTPKIPIFVFLRCLGLNLPVLNNYFQLNYSIFSNQKVQDRFQKENGNFEKLFPLENKHEQDELTRQFQLLQSKEKSEFDTIFSNSNQTFLTFCQKLYPKKNSLELKPKLGQKFLYRKFLNPRTYNLSPLGRYRINQKLGLQIPLDHSVLTAQDVLFACIYLMNLLEGVGTPDDIDDLKNRKIKSSGELIQTQLATGLIRLEKTIREKLKQSSHLGGTKSFKSGLLIENTNKKSVLEKLLTVKPINSSLREFFGTNPLAQLLDQTNPLAELTHKRRLSSLGPGGINRETAGMAIRGIHPTHYGRICPIETPEGQNAGLVNSVTIYSRINNKGFIETPFYKTYKGYILKTNQPLLFSSDQEEKLVIAPGDIKTSLFHFLPTGVAIPSRQLKEFKRVSRNEINYIALSPIQMISVATSLIPFLEHDDGNRALMGSNMQRQAVPTIRPSRPIVGTGLESRVVSDSGHGLQAKSSGFVSYVDGKKIVIYSSRDLLTKQSSKTYNLSNRRILKNYCAVHASSKSILIKNQPLIQRSVIEENKTLKCNASLLQKRSTSSFNLNQLFKTKQNLNLLFGKGSFENIFKIQKSKNVKIPALFGTTVDQNLGHLKAYQTTKQVYHIYNSLFTNQFFGQYEILKSFAQKSLTVQSDVNLTVEDVINPVNSANLLPSSQFFKPLLSKKRLTFLKQSSNQSALFEYLQLILNSVIKNQIFFSFQSFYAHQSSSFADFLNNQKFSERLTPFQTDTENLYKQSFYGLHNRRTLLKNNSITLSDGVLNNFLSTDVADQMVYKASQINLFKKNLNQFTLLNNLKARNQNNQFNKKLFVSKPPFLDFLSQDSSTFSTNQTSQSVSKKAFESDSFQILENFNKVETAKTEQQLKTFLQSQKEFCSGIVDYDLNKVQPLNFLNSKQFSNLAITNKKTTSLNTISSHKIAPTIYHLDSFHRSNQDTYLVHRPIVQQGQWVEKGDLLADNSASVQGELAIGQNILVGYTPWEGYNFEDAVLISERFVFDDLFTSLHIERYEVEIRDTQYGMEQMTNQLPNLNDVLDYLDENGIAKIGTWVHEGDVLVGKVAPLGQKTLSPYENLLYDIIGKEIPKTRETSLRVPRGVHGRVVHIEILQTTETGSYTNADFASRGKKIKGQSDQVLGTNVFNSKLTKTIKQKNGIFKDVNTTDSCPNISKNILKTLKNTNNQALNRHGKDQKQIKTTPTKVHIYLAEKRKIQVGDKIAGRHGNKGIVSNILPQQDMPYLPDGTPLDLVLNPLGVPSRMNVGQIFECLLGLAGYYLGQNYKIQPFDEIYGCEASRSLVYSKLYEARLKTGQDWLFNPNHPGKTRLFDGRTGECFEQPVTVGRAYILKLVHLVDEKIHARSTGPYSLVTQQPLRGRSKHGGQRVGEMEVWALEGFGAAYILQELLTIKSDDLKGRHQVMNSILNNQPMSFGTPESFKVLVRELQSLCLDISIYQIGKNGKPTQIDIIKLP